MDATTARLRASSSPCGQPQRLHPHHLGNSGDVPIIGDWNCDGIDDIGVYRPSNGTFYRYGYAAIAYGNVGDLPIIGDWNGNGIDEIGVYRPGNRTFYPRNRPLPLGR
ncbi:hypothetical protein ACFU53_29245 [Streptomyces sp. NPDC057474]|uniref:hypothetical protein n=1 Tax=Streptomyces sp. NPDC057474 TaxID=3346144 RepID=UPI0036828853